MKIINLVYLGFVLNWNHIKRQLSARDQSHRVTKYQKIKTINNRSLRFKTQNLSGSGGVRVTVTEEDWWQGEQSNCVLFFVWK